MPEGTKSTILIFVLWFAGLLAGAQFAKVSVLLPEFRELYPAPDERVAWLLTLVSIVGAVFGGIAGSFAVRVGAKRFLVGSLLAAGGLSLWQSTYPPFAIMAMSRVLEGVTHLGIVVTAPALMAQISSAKWRGATMALWSTFFGVSFAMFAWFGIPQVEALKVSGLFQLHGMCLFFIAGLLFLLLPQPKENDTDPDTSLASGSLALEPYKSLKVIWPGVGWLFYTLTFLALLTILPSQMPGELRHQLTTAMSLIGIATSLLFVPVLLLRLKATTVVILGFMFALLLSLFGSELSTPVLAVSLFAVLGAVQGGSFAAVAELNTSMAKRTLGYGFMAQTGNTGNLIGTPILFGVLNTSGSNTLMMTVVAIYGVALVSLIILAQKLRLPSQAS